MTGRDGFWRLVRAEWIKLRSVGRWRLTLLIGTLLTVGFGLVAASGSGTDINTTEPRPFDVSFDGRPVVDSFTFAHRPLAGDGSVTARVLTQSRSHEWAGAGVMIKENLNPGSRYAALVITPGHGLRLRANFSADRPGGPGGAPRWLRLTRTGSSITGYESTDAATWRTVGTVSLTGLPPTVEVGLVVYSPGRLEVVRRAGTTSAGEMPTLGRATFDTVRLDAPEATADPWRADAVGRPVTKHGPAPAPSMVEAGGVIELHGSGAIDPSPPADDPVSIGLFGVLVGLMVFIPLGVLFITSEYRRGMIRTTFALSRRRGWVLAAKAVVLGSTTFVLGLVATVTAYLATRPLLRANGFGPPAFPDPSLADPAVVRAVVGSAAVLAVMAVFALGVGTLLRHTAGAITVVIALVILPIFLTASLPVEAARWLMYLTPTGGLAVQRALPPTDVLAEPWAAIGPLAGLAVVCGYAVVALLAAYVALRRRDA